MLTTRQAFLALIAAGACGIANADTLTMGQGEYAGYFEQGGKPTRGMSQQSVEAKYGAPSSREVPVGEPPITRWEYPEFVVFFEYDRVIHAVTKR